MNARNRPLLGLAVTTVLMMPAALAQTAQGAGKAFGQTVTQSTPRSPPPALPPRTTDNTEALLNTNAPPSLQQLNEVEPPLPPEAEEAAMTPSRPPPANAEGATHAAGHSSIVQRDRWAQLDVDGDGRVSGAEGRVDADFKANFEMMDADKDGFVTRVEFRAQAKAADDDTDSRDKDDRDD